LIPIYERYEELTGIKINQEAYSTAELYNVIEVKIASGTTDYDVIAVDAPLLAAYVNRGYLAPLDEWVTAEDKDKLTDATLASACIDGAFYSPSLQSSSMVMYYNTALLKEAGIEMPESTVEDRMTWDEVVDIAQKTLDVIDPQRNAGYFGVEFRQASTVYQMNCIPNSLGGKNIGDDGYTVDGILNSQEWIDGMTWYQNLVKNKLTSRGIKSAEVASTFEAGKIVFMIDTTGRANTLRKNGMTDFDVMPVPTFEGYEDKVATGTGSWQLGVPAACENKEAAAEFVKWMTMEEGSRLFSEAVNGFPATKELLAELESNPNANKEMKIAAYEAQNTAVIRAQTPGFSEYQTIMNAAWEDVRNGEDVVETLNNAVEQLTPILEAYKK